MESKSEDEQSNPKLLKNNLNVYEKNKRLITIGQCSHFYLYLLGITICKLISILIIGGLKNNICLLGFSPILNSYGLTQDIYTYIGYIIFGIIFKYYSKKNEEINDERPKRILNLKIRNNNLITHNNRKKYFQITLVCFCFVFYYEALNILYDLGFHLLNYWTLETLFTFLLIKKYFSVEIYSHHKCSTIFIIISSSICIFIASWLPDSSGEGEEEPLNTYQFIKKKFESYYYSIIIVLFFIFLSFVYSFSRTFSKVLMETLNFSLHTFIILIGIIGLIIGLIASIIQYNINIKNNILNYFSDLKSCNKDYKFYLEILLVYPIFIVSRFMQMHFEMLIMYFLNPIYVLATNNLTFGTTKLVSFILNDSAYFLHFFFNILSEISALFGYTFYLEILELNFCGLSDNIKRNISDKGINEFKRLDNERIKSIEALYIEEEGDEKEDEENGNIKRKRYSTISKN